MEDLLLLKYPALRDRIQKARGDGLSDAGIERKIERTIERKLAGGWTMEQLASRLGQTPEARLAFREASRLNAMETVSDAYELPYGKARAVVETSEREDLPIPSVVEMHDVFQARLHERETTEWREPVARLNLKGEDVLSRMASGIVVGAMGSAQGLFDAADWVTGWKKAKGIADGLDEASRSLASEILGGRKGNLFDSVMQGIGSTGVFLIPGVAAASLATRGASSASRAVRLLSAIAGASAMSVTESLTEAGSVYRTAKARTGDDVASSAAASWTFWSNLPTNFLSDKVAFFSELPGFERVIGKFVPAKWAPVVAQMVKGGVAESVQETMQGAISQHYGEGTPWSALDLSEIAYREGLPAAVVGALFGIGVGQEARDVRERENREKEVRRSAERVMEKAREELSKTGRPAEETDSISAILAAYSMTAAERDGVTPEEWFEGKGLTVAEAEAEGELVLKQGDTEDLGDRSQQAEPTVPGTEPTTGPIAETLEAEPPTPSPAPEAEAAVPQSATETGTTVFPAPEAKEGTEGRSRGQIGLSSGKAILKIFETADASTIVHELGHLFLDDIQSAMNRGRLSAKAMQDYRTIIEWLEAEEGKPLTREQHEKFARGFEAYLREGRAPSLRLRSVFERFRKWMTKIYAKAESLNVDLTDDIRGVFDRMLAFEPDIEVARRVEAAEREDAATEVRFPDWLKLDEDEGDDDLDRLEQALAGNAEALASIVDEEPVGKTREDLLQEAVEEARQAVLSAVPKADGKGKVGDFVREWAALLELREEVRANRKGTSALKYSATLKVIRERLSENSRLRQEAIAILKSIKRSASGKISARAREEIRERLGKYDLSAIRDESGRQELRAQFERYLADEPDPDPKVEEEAEGLSAVAAGEMTLGDLYAILQDVKGIAKRGREEYERWQLERAERTGNVRAELERDLPDRIEAGPVTSRSRKAPAGVREKTLGVLAKTLRPARLFRLLDGGLDNGPWTRRAMREARKCRDAFLRQKNARLEWLERTMEEHGIAWGDLGAIRLQTKNEAGQEIALTLEECMHAYVAYGNWLNRMALRYGNGWGKSVLLEAIGALTAEERAFADAILKEEESHFDRINGVLEQVFQIKMEKVDNHVSMFRIRDASAGTPADNAIQEHVSTIAKLSSMKRTIMRRGFAEARKILGPELQSPIQTGLVSVWLRTMTTTEYTAAFADLAMTLQDAVNQGYSGSPSLLRKIEDRYGRGFAEAVKNWVNTITMPDFYRAFSSMDDLLRKVRANSGIARMAFNLLSAGKQLISFVLMVPYAGPVHMASAIAQFAADPKGTCEFVWARDPHVKEQAVDRLLEELKLAGVPGVDRYRHKLASVGFAPMLWLDMAVRVTGWKAVYDRLIAKGFSEAEAISVAQSAILATQNAADPEELPLYMKGGELMNLVTQFTNQANQIYNITFYDIPADFLSGHSGRAFGGIVGLTLSALLVGLMNNGEPPEDPEDLIQWVLQEELGSLPLIGNAIAATLAGYRASGTAIDSMGAALARAGKETAQGDYERALMATGEFAALASGLPFVGLKRIYKALVSGEPGALLGWDR